jgi:hypothetical protein
MWKGVTLWHRALFLFALLWDCHSFFHIQSSRKASVTIPSFASAFQHRAEQVGGGT